MAKWVAHLLVEQTAQDWISLLPKLAIHCLHEGCPEGEPAVTTLIQYTLLLVEKVGAAPDMNFRFPWGRSHEVQNRGNQWPHKIDLGPTKNLCKSCNWWIQGAPLAHPPSNHILLFLHTNFTKHCHTGSWPPYGISTPPLGNPGSANVLPSYP